ncbi:hypothetical protein RRG08_026162 [Elysia crispata]|uniref:Uncharacterized protein n=1 Tax=Elysia crispata TaxID=231223 RepID=A0AAE0ZBM1_9GAST|nr:hypothetical protein RRG08_026162 [Elysia crispata]
MALSVGGKFASYQDLEREADMEAKSDYPIHSTHFACQEQARVHNGLNHPCRDSCLMPERCRRTHLRQPTRCDGPEGSAQ